MNADLVQAWQWLPARMPGRTAPDLANHLPEADPVAATRLLEQLVAGGWAVRVHRHGRDVYYRGLSPPAPPLEPARSEPPAVLPGTVIPPPPWEQVLLLPVDRAVPGDDRVQAAVAAHRALIAAIGDGAPPVLTGTYPPGVPRPANRLAIQFLDHTPHVGGPAVALLLPRRADPTDLTLVRVAAGQLRRRGLGSLTVGSLVEVPADRLWPSPDPGTVRWWRTEPAAVPDTGRPRGGRWGLADAVALSVALVWRDEWPTPAGGKDARIRALAAAPARSGVRVHAVTAVGGDPGRHVHKIHPTAVVRPYRAVLDLGGLAGVGAVVAVGQTRHLGGGLLTPVDLPADVAARLARPARSPCAPGGLREAFQGR